MKSTEHRRDLGYSPAPEIPPAQTKQITYHQTSPAHPKSVSPSDSALAVRHCHYLSAVPMESSLSSPLTPQAQPVTKFCNSVSQALLSYCPFSPSHCTVIFQASEQLHWTVAIAANYFLFPLLTYWVPKVSFLNLSSD